MEFKRITIDPEKMGGVPCIRGLRIPVATVVAMLAERMTYEEILDDYPDLEFQSQLVLGFAAYVMLDHYGRQ